MKHEDIAVIKRNNGYNCAQAVLCAYAEELGMDEKQLFALSEGFGSGLGCTFGTCGALNAACMIQSAMSSTCHLTPGFSYADKTRYSQKDISKNTKFIKNI